MGDALSCSEHAWFVAKSRIFSFGAGVNSNEPKKDSAYAFTFGGNIAASNTASSCGSSTTANAPSGNNPSFTFGSGNTKGLGERKFNFVKKQTYHHRSDH